MFTRKHYVAIADLIHKRRRELKSPASTGSVDAGATVQEEDIRLDELAHMTLELSKLFKSDNPKFKEFTFIETCNRDLKE